MAGDEATTKRVQEICDALVTRRVELSLAKLETVLAAWRRGDVTVEAAHAEVMRHPARVSLLTSRLARALRSGADAMLRDAFDLGLCDAREFEQLTGKAPGQVAPPPSLDDELHGEPAPGMPKKREVVDKLLADGAILLHIDSRCDGVDVPPSHRDQAQLVLRFGHGLTPPILDLRASDERIEGTLTFKGTPHRCLIPWKAVYAIVSEDGRGLVWPNDVPPEVEKEFLSRPRNAPASDRSDRPEPEPPKSKRGAHLKLVT